MPDQVPSIVTKPPSTIEIPIVRAVAVMDASDITLQVRVHSRTITGGSIEVVRRGRGRH